MKVMLQRKMELRKNAQKLVKKTASTKKTVIKIALKHVRRNAKAKKTAKNHAKVTTSVPTKTRKVVKVMVMDTSVMRNVKVENAITKKKQQNKHHYNKIDPLQSEGIFYLWAEDVEKILKLG